MTQQVTTETTSEKLARLRAAKAARDAVAAEEADALELQVLELEEALSSDGKRGVDFEILVHGEHVLAVRRGSGLLFKSFSNSKMSEKETIDFVKGCAVSPTKEKVQELLEDFPALANRAALALAELYGAKRSADAGK